MGGALVFVITLSSFVTGLIYKFILVPSGMEYLQTIVFILIIAALPLGLIFARILTDRTFRYCT